mmetsp:Transcript_64095/g.198495  ORF Transcript_64095/g.198495 Transcript_64095/m.198495 type:complete len:264 (+) Transcript_64095:249-1040(+)
MLPSHTAHWLSLSFHCSRGGCASAFDAAGGRGGRAGAAAGGFPRHRARGASRGSARGDGRALRAASLAALPSGGREPQALPAAAVVGSSGRGNGWPQQKQNRASSDVGIRPQLSHWNCANHATMEAEGPTDDGGTERDIPDAGRGGALSGSYRLGRASRPGGSPGLPRRPRSIVCHWASALLASLLESEGARRIGYALDTDGKVGADMEAASSPRPRSVEPLPPHPCGLRPAPPAMAAARRQARAGMHGEPRPPQDPRGPCLP